MAKTTKAEKKRLTGAFVYEGKRYYVKAYTKKELNEKLFQKRKEVEEGGQNRINPKLNDYYNTFTENRRRKVKESTLRCQSFQFRNCADIVIDRNGKTLGEYRLSDIRPDDIQLVQRTLEKSKRTTETINNSIDHLRHVFNQAVRSRYIEYNPCDATQNLKRTEAPARDTIHRALTIEETKKFFREAKDSYYYNHFAIMIKTGIRIGELAALVPFDLNTKTKELAINKTVAKDEIGAYIISDSPKTDAGNRLIPVKDDVIRIIADQRARNKVNPFHKGQTQIFKSPEGALLREYQINREIARICKRTGIEKFTCHAFRATFATRWIEQQPDRYKELSEILGHSTTKITLDLYAHSMKDTKIKAMNGVEIAI